MTNVWYSRTWYGNVLKRLIRDQEEYYDKAVDIESKMKIGKSIAYLIQVQSQLISAEKNVGERLEELERIAGMTQRSQITV